MKTDIKNIGKEIYLIFGRKRDLIYSLRDNQSAQKTKNDLEFFTVKGRIIDSLDEETYLVYSKEMAEKLNTPNYREVELKVNDSLNCPHFYRRQNQIYDFPSWICVENYCNRNNPWTDYLFGFAFDEKKKDKIIDDFKKAYQRYKNKKENYFISIGVPTLDYDELRELNNADDFFKKRFNALLKENYIPIKDVSYRPEYFGADKVKILDKFIKIAKGYIVKDNVTGEEIKDYEVKVTFNVLSSQDFPWKDDEDERDSTEGLIFRKLTKIDQESFNPKIYKKDDKTYVHYNNIYGTKIHIKVDNQLYRLPTFLRKYSIFKIGE